MNVTARKCSIVGVFFHSITKGDGDVQLGANFNKGRSQDEGDNQQQEKWNEENEEKTGNEIPSGCDKGIMFQQKVLPFLCEPDASHFTSASSVHLAGVSTKNADIEEYSIYFS